MDALTIFAAVLLGVLLGVLFVWLLKAITK